MASVTDWREARADLAARAKASVIVPGWENDLMAAADAYATAKALWALDELQGMDELCCPGDAEEIAALRRRIEEAEHD